jgi:hypothetical protein
MEGFFFFATRQLLPGTQINIATSSLKRHNPVPGLIFLSD